MKTVRNIWLLAMHHLGLFDAWMNFETKFYQWKYRVSQTVKFEKIWNDNILGFHIQSRDGDSRRGYLVIHLFFTTLYWKTNLLKPIMARTTYSTAKYREDLLKKTGKPYMIEEVCRSFEFSICKTCVRVAYGYSEGFGCTTFHGKKPWGASRHFNYPWVGYESVGTEYFDANGVMFTQKSYKEGEEVFCDVTKIKDYDGEIIHAYSFRTIRRYKKWEGMKRILGRFRPTKVFYSLDITFDRELGPEKGSWKGGTCGHSLDCQKSDFEKTDFELMLKYADRHNTQPRTKAYPIEALCPLPAGQLNEAARKAAKLRGKDGVMPQ